MATWAEFRERVRRSILGDAVNSLDPDFEYDWSDDQLLDCYQWAVDQFAAHTAKESIKQFDAATEKSPGVFYDLAVDRSFTLPTDMYDATEWSGRVRVVRGNTVQHLDPADVTESPHAWANTTGFSVFAGQLLVTYELQATDTLILDYFAYWPVPALDSDVLPIPRWAEVPISYLMGAHAMTQASVKAAKLSEHKTKSEAGQPEHNSWRAQHKWFMQLYAQALAEYPHQERLNAHRNR